MKKIILFCLLFCSVQIILSQNFRKPYREAKRALNKKDYVTATLKSIESIKAKKTFKKSISIFKKSLPEVNGWGDQQIKQLEPNAIPFKDYRSVDPMNKIFITYAKLNSVQEKLLELPKSFSLKQKVLISSHTKDYSKKLNDAGNLLDAYKNNAAEEFYADGVRLFNNAVSKNDYKHAYKTLARSKNYKDNYKDVQSYMNRALTLGTLNVGYFPVRNLTSLPSNRKAMNEIVNSTIGLFNNYPFANYYDIRSKVELRRLGVLGEKGKEQLKNIDELVQFKFLKYYAGPTVIKSREYYENKKEKKKKDGSIKTWFCKGYIYEVAASGIIEAEITIFDNNGDILEIYRVTVDVDHEDNFFLASKDSDRRAYPLLKKFTRTMPQPYDTAGVLMNRFRNRVNGVYKRYD